MPQRQRQGTRSTVDLHADWWSEDQGADGRFKERVVIYTSLLYREQKAQQDRLFASGALGKVDLGKLQALDADALARGDAAALSALAGEAGLDLAALARDDEADLLLWIHEVTDASGDVVLGRDPASGALPADAAETLGELEDRDVAFVRAAVRARMAQAVVPVLPADVSKAERGDPRAANGRGPAAIAEDEFRPAGG